MGATGVATPTCDAHQAICGLNVLLENVKYMILYPVIEVSLAGAEVAPLVLPLTEHIFCTVIQVPTTLYPTDFRQS